ncbi:MAG: sulfatase [bacterium]|nr:sulfatase [bacterium]
MAVNPFDSITQKTRLKARLGHFKRTITRPFRPTKIDLDRSGPHNLLLLGIDTLRADHLGFQGYDAGPTSPNLDRLVKNGTVFSDATAPAPWTLPSFSSALTGVMPGLHGGFLSGDTRNMDQQPPARLDPEVMTLATHLKSQGYRTAAFYSNQFFAFGLAESFDHHEYHNLPARDVAAIAMDWIRQNADRPFFCFVLFNDPHEPTTPDLEDLNQFLGSDEISSRELVDYARWGKQPSGHLGYMGDSQSDLAKAAVRTKLAVYDATIRTVDRVIGQMHEQMKTWSLAEHTLFSVFSDHGEEFLDHVEFARKWNHDPREIRGIGHGHTHFQELLHVPWAAWGAGVPSGIRNRDAVSLCDLAPTLLAWLQLPAMEQAGVMAKFSGGAEELSGLLTGRSVASGSDEGKDRVILAEAIAFGPDLVAIRRGRWKMIARRDGFVMALFDLMSGPDELVDVQGANPDVVGEMLEILGQWRDSGTGAGGAESQGGSNWNEMDDPVRQRLKDLGYSD